jgi:hypothetical protein
MKRLSVILAGSVIALALTGATTLHRPPLDARQLHLRSEQTRLRAHFDSVDGELRTANVAGLNAQQRAMRVKLIAWLRDYRNAGSFPENDRFADRAMPFFRDSHATLCAMAYLVDRSGRGDIVDHIARTRNNAFIHELVDDAQLVDWLKNSGLTVDEAARIQPTYGPPPVIVDNPDRVSSNYALLSMGLGGAALGSIGMNVFSPSRFSNALGFIAGVAAIAAGGSHMKDGGGNRKVAIADAWVGSVSAVTAVVTSFRHPRQAAAAKGTGQQARSETGVSPEVVVIGNKQQLGLGLHARF